MPEITVYAALTDDRHTDTTVDLFFGREDAIAFARERARSRCSQPEDYAEEDVDGWEFCAVYCESEGDLVRVLKTTLGGAAPAPVGEETP